MNPRARGLPAALLLSGFASLALAQTSPLPGDYPKKQPVRIIAGVAPGGGTDIIAREMAQQLTRRMGGSFIVENKTGASGAIAMRYVAAAAPDGYTLYVAANSAMAIAPMLKTVDFDTRKAFSPIVHMDTQPYVLTVAQVVPVNTLKDLIAYAKANPKKLNSGSSGYTSPSYTGMVDFQSLTGTTIQNVPYKGASAAMRDVVSGRLQIVLGSSATVSTHVKAGKVKALAVTAERRTKAFPDVPTAAEAGVPGLNAVITHSLFATGGTPRVLILALNKAANEAMQDPQLVARLEALGTDVEDPNTPDDLERRIDDEVRKWTKFYKDHPEALRLK